MILNSRLTYDIERRLSASVSVLYCLSNWVDRDGDYINQKV